jgi:(2Fe-2S) ferredoxin
VWSDPSGELKENAVPRITSLEELNRLRVELVMERNRAAEAGCILVTVAMGTCGIAAGATEVYEALQAGIGELQATNVLLSQTGCMGLCKHEPIVEVTIGTHPKVSYGGVTASMAERILQEHIIGGKVVGDLVIDTTPFPTI